MSTVKVLGGNRLYGNVNVQGCKNAVLPIIAASLLSCGVCVIHNCPRLADVYASVKILKELGAGVSFENNTLVIDSTYIECRDLKPELMSTLRSSVIFLGAVLSRCSRATVAMPGGCDIGKRPIDIHLTAFERMGVDVECNGEEVVCAVNNLHGENIYLPFPSVGATENIMLLAASGKGVTTIHNAAREPEIVDLQNFLNAMGARVFGAGTGMITIYAVSHLCPCEYTVMPDRIEASTFLCAVSAAGGETYIGGINPVFFKPVIGAVCCGGAVICEYSDGIYVRVNDVLSCPPVISTAPYPGFPTDAQSLMMSVMSCSVGEGEIRENIFENRLGHGFELAKMGADIAIDGNRAYIRGTKLSGSDVTACDLRSGAALVVAALSAEGETCINGAEYIDRGYDGLINKLADLGAKCRKD